MLIKDTLKLLEEIDTILDNCIDSPFVENKCVDKTLLQGGKNVKERELKTSILNNLYTHFKDYKFLKNVQIIGDRLQFWLPEDKTDWIYLWRDNSKALQNGKLKLFLYDSLNGYVAEIQ